MSDRDTLFIDGKWQPADNGEDFEVTDPADCSLVGRASDAGVNEAGRAVEAALYAFPAWSAEAAHRRASVLRDAYVLMRERSAELAALITREQGKPLAAAREEVRRAADHLVRFAEQATRVHASTLPSGRSDQRLTVLRRPLGVVVAITSWNDPVSVVTRKLAPALAAGCTVVLKPSEQAPLCAVAVFDILADAGLPAGVANLVTTGRPAAVAERMVTAPCVRKLSFTGSTAVGTGLAAMAAAGAKSVSLELGGQSPMIVFDDASLSPAAAGAVQAKFLNGGQAALGLNRIFVHRSVYEAFSREVVARTRRLVTGPGDRPGACLGPLVNEAALQRTGGQVKDALAKGARLLAGGHRLTGDGLDGGFFFAPTVLADVDESMRIYREEASGPVAALIPFDGEAEAIRRANDIPYGPASYVYTNDLGRAVRATEALRFGIVGVNDPDPTGIATFSGGGGEGGPGCEGVDDYLDVKLASLAVR